MNLVGGHRTLGLFDGDIRSLSVARDCRGQNAKMLLQQVMVTKSSDEQDKLLPGTR